MSKFSPGTHEDEYSSATPLWEKFVSRKAQGPTTSFTLEIIGVAPADENSPGTVLDNHYAGIVFSHNFCSVLVSLFAHYLYASVHPALLLK